MTLGDLAQIIKKTGNPQQGSLSDDTKPHYENDDLDKKYKDLNKKYRNWLAYFDHLYELISHPFVVFVIFAVAFIVFIVSRYLEIIFPGWPVFRQIHQDTKTAVSYLLTAIGTSIFTIHFEKRKRGM